MKKSPSCEDHCQLAEHKGYPSCEGTSGRCELACVPAKCSYAPCRLTGQCCEDDRRDEREAREFWEGMSQREIAGWVRAMQANVD